MKRFAIHVAFVAWGVDGGKRRPVIIISEKRRKDGVVFTLGITSKYNADSPYVKENYVEIVDWELSNLEKQSYIDAGRFLQIPIEAIDNAPTGYLSLRDRKTVEGIIRKLINR